MSFLETYREKHKLRLGAGAGMTISYLCVDTAEPGLAAATLEHCNKVHPVDEIILITDDSYKNDALTHCYGIPKIKSIEEYSYFMTHHLSKYVTTDYVIIVQTDGYVINDLMWQEMYLSYDYIGAPWSMDTYHNVEGIPKCAHETIVGNGGFSLRSKKLIDLTCEFFKDNPHTMYHPEDAAICRGIRDHLDTLGCTFAPTHISNMFSCENTPYHGSFGFHGKGTMHINEIPYIDDTSIGALNN